MGRRAGVRRSSSRSRTSCRGPRRASSGSRSGRAVPVGSGGLAAWVGFTLPSAMAMTALALAVGSADVSGAGWVHGLELVAVPVVALAVLAMRRSLAPDLARLALAAVAAAVAIAWDGFGGQAAAIALGAVVGVLAFRGGARSPSLTAPFPASQAGGRLLPRRVRGAPGRPAGRRGRYGLARGSAVRRHVPLRLARVRRRARRPAAAPRRGRGAGLGRQSGLPRRLRARAGDARAALHVLRVPGSDPGTDAERSRRGSHRRGRDLPPVVPPPRRRACRSGRRSVATRSSRPLSPGSVRRSSASSRPRCGTPC